MLLFLSSKLQKSISSDYVGDNVGKAYDYLCDLFYDCEESLTLKRLGTGVNLTPTALVFQKLHFLERG